MDCPTCSCGSSSCTGCIATEANGPVQPIKTGLSIRVSDRNGLPRDLVGDPFSIPFLDENNRTSFRDGSALQPINLKNINSVSAVVGKVFVIDGEGNIAALTPTDEDGYFVKSGNVIKFSPVLPSSNFFASNEVNPAAGKLLVLGCQTNGRVSIGFYNSEEKDYVSLNSDGFPEGKNFCDAEESDTFDSIFGCSGGVFKKLTGVAGSKLVVNEEGKFELASEVSDRLKGVNPKILVAAKKIGGVPSPSFSIHDVPITQGEATGTYNMLDEAVPGYIEGGLSVQLRLVCYSDTAPSPGTESHSQITINGIVLAETWIDSGNEFAFQNSMVYECPLENDQFNYAILCEGNGTAFGKIEIVGFRNAS